MTPGERVDRSMAIPYIKPQKVVEIFGGRPVCNGCLEVMQEQAHYGQITKVWVCRKCRLYKQKSHLRPNSA